MLTCAFGLWLVTTFDYGRDQGIYAVVARSMLDGGMPYRDAWDFKPPGIFVIYALARALMGEGQVAIRMLEALGLAAMALGMTELARRWWGEARVGLLAAALAILVHAQLDFWHTAQPESFGGMLTIAALLCAGRDEPVLGGRGTSRRPWAWWILCGALFGAAGLLKPPLAGGGVVVAGALSVWRLRRTTALAARQRRLDAAAPLLGVFLGGCLPVLACAAWFGARGALGHLHDVLFVFTPYYTAIGWQNQGFTGMAWWGLTEWLVTYSAVFAGGLALLLGFHPRDTERPAVWLLAALIGVHVLGVVLQGKFFPYHYGATWPLTALLASLGLWRLWERLERFGVTGALAFAGLLGVLAVAKTATKDVPGTFWTRTATRMALNGREDVAARDALASVADVHAPANRAVAETLAAAVSPDRSVFVWGFEPVIYDMSGRRAATRFIYDVPQRVAWASESMRGQLMADLAADPPAAIVVEHRDVFPMVTGDLLDSADSLLEFPALRALVADRYQLASSIEDFDIYLNRDPALAGDVTRP
ncbi:MAG: glycosyltransferase family 39 protein [Polyangiaceae bacterium]